MQLQETTQTSALRVTYFQEKCAQFTKDIQGKELHVKIENIDDLLAAKILTSITDVKISTENNFELPRATDYSLNSHSKTLTAYLCNPTLQNLNYALTSPQSNDALLEYVTSTTQPKVQNVLKIPLLNELPLIKAITNCILPILPELTSNEKNTAALLEEININTKRKYSELTMDEKKTLTGQLVKHALETNVTKNATLNLTGQVYVFENEIASNSQDLLVKAQAALNLNKLNTFIKCNPSDVNTVKQLNTTTSSYLNMQKATIKHALRMTSDYGKFNYYDCKKLPAWLGEVIGTSLQTLEKYAAKPLVVATSQDNETTLREFVNQVKVKEITTSDVNAALKEINLQLTSEL